MLPRKTKTPKGPADVGSCVGQAAVYHREAVSVGTMHRGGTGSSVEAWWLDSSYRSTEVSPEPTGLLLKWGETGRFWGTSKPEICLTTRMGGSTLPSLPDVWVLCNGCFL